MELFSIIMLSWIASGWVAGSIFTYLDVKLAGHKFVPEDLLFGVLVIGGIFGPAVFFFMLRDLQYFYPMFKKSKGE